MEIKSVPLKGKEYFYTFRNSQQISSQTGLIGYIRADMYGILLNVERLS